MRAAGRGRIVNLSSMGGRMTFPLGGYYHATKYAVEALSDALRVEVKPFGVAGRRHRAGGHPQRVRGDDQRVRRARLARRLPLRRDARVGGRGQQRRLRQPRLSASAESVAQALVKAVEADRPRTRYLLTPAARAMVDRPGRRRRPGLGRPREAPVQPLMVALLEPLEAPVHPIEALRRVAFLLERTRAGTYRVEAFRNAVKTLKPLDEAELRERAEAGTLQEIPGIGKSTSGGHRRGAGRRAARVPGLAAGEVGRAARRGRRGDVRARCAATATCTPTGATAARPIDEMVLTGIELGHEWLVLTDHSPQLRVANGLTVERLTQQIGIVEAIDRVARRVVPAAQGHRGRHPRRRRARPDRRDARAARPRHGIRAQQAADERGADDDPDGQRRRRTLGSTCSATAPGASSRGTQNTTWFFGGVRFRIYFTG